MANDGLIGKRGYLVDFPHSHEAKRMLKYVTAFVKPIMVARKLKVKELFEFYPEGDDGVLGKSRKRRRCDV